ncbi:MAG TPA: NUDIX hydrolase, partial [Polyangiales bacterium]|nr:NUDIX hydrolase [Polyangiales bacterium]
MTSPEVLPPRPAATLVLLRAAPEGCEVLLLRRKSELAFYGGAWVFPGGGIDAADHAEGSVPAHELPHDAPPPLAARNAALRELREEAGLSLPADAPICFSRWITPPGRTRRFDTWFFVALAPEHTAAVQLDAGEVDAFRWMTPSAALQARARREIE